MNIASLTQTASRFLGVLNHLQPLWWLGVRVWLAVIFFKSGLVKLEDFDTTILLFAEEYNVPVIPPAIAAYSATFFELTCPILLVLGLGTRLAVLPLIAMTAVIQFTYLDHVQHYYWGILLLGLLIHGAGRYSADARIARVSA